jgi:hypothetical protein
VPDQRDDVRVGALDLRQHGLDGRHDVGEHEVVDVAQQRGLRGVLRREADHGEAHPVPLDQGPGREAVRPPRGPVGVRDVGGQPLELRPGDARFERAASRGAGPVGGRAVVELVVADRGRVHADQIEGVDGAPALGGVDGPISLEHVAAVEQDEVGGFRPQRVHGADDPRETAVAKVRLVLGNLLV